MKKKRPAPAPPVSTHRGLPPWNPLSPSGVPPAQRVGATLVSDPVRQRLLMIGGDSKVAGVVRPGDTWALYFDSTTPTQLSLVSDDATSERVTLRWLTG